MLTIYKVNSAALGSVLLFGLQDHTKAFEKVKHNGSLEIMKRIYINGIDVGIIFKNYAENKQRL
jgi:hypothetical protein